MANALSSITEAPQRRKLLIIGTSTILVLCLVWLVYQFGGALVPAPVATPPDSPRDRFAAEMQATIKEDPRFRHADVIPDPENDAGLLVTGDVGSAADEAALRVKAAEVGSTYPLRFDVYIMKR